MPRILLVALLLGLSFTSQAAQTAEARLHAWSLRFSWASASGTGGLDWELDLTTVNSVLNGELMLDPYETGYSHSSFVDLYDELYETVYAGFLALDTPDAGDANGNGFPDFFEVSQPVNGLVTAGSLQIDELSYLGNVQATWQRDAGSAFGTCVLSLPEPFSTLHTLNFFHSFQMIEYTGRLTYEPGATRISGRLTLTNNATGETLRGPVQFEKSIATPANALTLQSAFLTNALSDVLSLYTNTTVFRDDIYPTNYFGTLEFLDGDPGTAEEDYYSWQLSIDDPNDSDQDGIPDFSDTPGGIEPRAPSLTLTRGPGSLRLTISGDVGSTCQVEQDERRRNA